MRLRAPEFVVSVLFSRGKTMQTGLYSHELFKIRQAEAERLAAEDRRAAIAQRARRRTRRALWTKLAPARARDAATT